MSTTIQDGTGTNYRAAVDSDYRLQTKSVTVSELAASTERGESFVGASDFVTLTTTGSFSGIFYIKNDTTDKDFHIESIRTCNDSFAYWKLFSNPTGGTLLSGGTSALLVNGSVGDAFVPANTTLIGADSLTQVGGTLVGTLMQGAGHSIQEFKGGLEIGSGDSLALFVKPTVNPTEVCIQIIGFVKDEGTV